MSTKCVLRILISIQEIYKGVPKVEQQTSPELPPTTRINAPQLTELPQLSTRKKSFNHLLKAVQLIPGSLGNKKEKHPDLIR